MKRALASRGRSVVRAGASRTALPATTPAASPLAHHDANQPIAISADNFVAEKNPATAGGITGTYSGNVIITQGDIRMRADTVRISRRQQQAAEDLLQRQCRGEFRVRHGNGRHRRL